MLISVAILVSYFPALLFPNFPFEMTKIFFIWRISQAWPFHAWPDLPQITESFSKVHVLPPWQEEPLICPSHPLIALIAHNTFTSTTFYPSPTCVDVFNKMWNEIRVHSVPYYPASYQGNTESWHRTQGGILHASVPPTQSRVEDRKNKILKLLTLLKITIPRYSITIYLKFSSNKIKNVLSFFLFLNAYNSFIATVFQWCGIFSRLWLDSAHFSQGLYSFKIIAGSCLKWEQINCIKSGHRLDVFLVMPVSEIGHYEEHSWQLEWCQNYDLAN